MPSPKRTQINPRFKNGLPIDIPANVVGLKRISELSEAVGIGTEALSAACYKGKMKSYRSRINNSYYSTLEWAEEYSINRVSTGGLAHKHLSSKATIYNLKPVPKDREPGDLSENSIVSDLPRKAEEVKAQQAYEAEIRQLARELPDKLREAGITVITKKNRGEGLKVLPQSFKRYPGYYGFSVR